MEQEPLLSDSPTLNDLIAASGMTWRQIAVAVGVKTSAISYWCHADRAKRKDPSLRNAIKLAIALKTDLVTIAKALEIPEADKL
jgi:transcriptional regulator with XRE-family HTH domain